MNQQKIKDNRDEKKWIMCPVCHEANSPENTFCRHCNGNRITKLDPEQPLLSLAEIEQLKNKWLVRRRKRKIVKKVVFLTLPALAVVAITVGILFYFTDVLGAPRKAIDTVPLPGEWPMYRHDKARTGDTGRPGAAPAGELKWSFTTGAPILASPTVADGTVYIGSVDGYLYAIDAGTGSELWRFKTQSWIESSAAVTGGVVYVGSDDGGLYALDADTGSKLWVHNARYGVRSSPAIADGKVYFGTGEFKVYALNAQTGEIIWDFEAGGNILASPVVANGIVYIGEMGDFLYALDARTGKKRLEFKAYGGVSSSASVIGDTVYFINRKGIIFAIDGTARNWIGEHYFRLLLYKIYVQSLSIVPPLSLIPPSQSGYLWGFNVGDASGSSPVIVDNTLYIAAGKRFIAIYTDQKKIRWTFDVGSSIDSSPAVADGVFYCGSYDGNLYALEADTGSELWRFSAGARITSSPAVDDGVVYFGSTNGVLYAVK